MKVKTQSFSLLHFKYINNRSLAIYKRLRHIRLSFSANASISEFCDRSIIAILRIYNLLFLHLNFSNMLFEAIPNDHLQ
jgi:hypothetical protein